MKHIRHLCTGLSIALVPLLNSCMTKMSESVSDPKAGFNGGFEQVKNNLPVNWLVYTQQTTGKGDFEPGFDTANFKEGKQSLCFKVRSCSSKGGRFSPGVSQETDVAAGEKYRVSYWVKNEGCHFSVKVSSVNATEGSDVNTLSSSNTISEWKQYTFDCEIQEAMERLKIDVSVLQPGTFWIDGITVERI